MGINRLAAQAYLGKNRLAVQAYLGINRIAAHSDAKQQQKNVFFNKKQF